MSHSTCIMSHVKYITYMNESCHMVRNREFKFYFTDIRLPFFVCVERIYLSATSPSWNGYLHTCGNLAKSNKLRPAP